MRAWCVTATGEHTVPRRSVWTLVQIQLRWRVVPAHADHEDTLLVHQYGFYPLPILTFCLIFQGNDDVGKSRRTPRGLAPLTMCISPKYTSQAVRTRSYPENYLPGVPSAFAGGIWCDLRDLPKHRTKPEPELACDFRCSVDPIWTTVEFYFPSAIPFTGTGTNPFFSCLGHAFFRPHMTPGPRHHTMRPRVKASQLFAFR